MRTIRQGDVLIIINGAKGKKRGAEVPRENNRVVLAYGEVTGHAHAISDAGCALYAEASTVSNPDAMTMIGIAGGLIPDRILEVTAPVGMLHEEHDREVIPAGRHIVRIQREYSPGELRNVQD